MPPPRHLTDTRKPYPGHSRSLVIAIDIGTTFSGVSYAILEPGEIPKIHGVTRFPGQEHVAGNTKIPSVIYYDRHGKMMAAGAEADTSGIQAQAEDEGWIKAELFKLRLRPRTMQLNMNGMRLGPLPKRKTAVHVFGDFLAYLYRCTRNFITDTHANGSVLWNQVESDIQFVLSHPNGWEGAQQSKMRRAAIYGGLIPETNEGKARIRFVTEGEASLHACVLNGLAADVLSNPSKHGFLIADAGGGTLDISAYAIKGASPLVIEEIAPPDCIFAGSVFVSRRAREFLEGKLKNSRYGTPDALDHITKRFDETTKRLFRDRKDLQFVPFGSPLDKDSTVGIRGGQLKLTGQEVADLFEPSVDAAFKAIRAQIEASQGMIKSVFLVGGYAASPWLFGQLQERLARYKVAVSRPDTQTSKAVADGAIGFYCDHHVSARMSKFMYGVEFLREMDPRDPDHVARKERLCELPSGPKLLPDAFDCILARGIRVKESTVFTRKYCTELTSLSMLSVFEVEIWCYRGGNTIPKWINRQADNFSTLCVVRADLSPLAGSAEPKAGRSGKTYWTIVFSVEIQFGLTEFKARIKWVDNGVTKYGPASIIYNERGHRADEDEPDVYPEDEANTASTSTTPRSAGDRNRSEPVSRARTPVAEHKRDSIPPSTVSSRRPSQSHPRSELSYASGTGGGIPEVARLDRDRSVSRGHGSPSISSSRNGYPTSEKGNGGYESDRRTVSSSKSKDRERNERMDTPRATPRSTKIGDTLSSVWGAGGSQSNTASPKRSAAPSPALGSTEPPPVGSTTRGSSIYGDRPKSPWVDQQQQLHTPSHQSTRTIGSQHPSQQKSPWVETISTTIENPKSLSPWDTIPSAIPRSISNASGHSGISNTERERTEKDRMSSLWDDAPRSSYGDPPKTPWSGPAKTPSHTTQQLGPGEESTVLLATTTPGSTGVPVELPQQTTTTLSRSLSVGGSGGKSPHVPVDVDDVPPVGASPAIGWGGVTPRSISTGTPGGGDNWDTGLTTPSALHATPTPSTTSSKIPKRSRKNSVAASALSTAKIGSPAKSPFGSLGGGGEDLNPGVPPSMGSPNLLAGAPGIGGHSGHGTPNKQVLSPLNPAAHDSGASFFDAPVDAPGGTITPGGGGATDDAFNWGTSAPADTWNHDAPNDNNATDTWGFNDVTQQPQHGTPGPTGESWGLVPPSPNQPVIPASPAQPPAPTPIETKAQTPKTPGAKTPKSIGSKTPKTPAAEMKTPITESVASPVVEGSTPTTPTAEPGGKKKKKKGTAAAAAAAAAAEEEERKRKEQEAEEERKRLEEEEQARIAKEAEEEAEKARIAAEADAAAAAQAAAAAEAEAERLAKEEEERLAKEIADLEAEQAREKAEKERKEKESKAAALALADTPGKGKKGKKGKKAKGLDTWEEEQEKEKERLAQELKEAEDRAAKEIALEQEARERAEQEAWEAAEREAKEKAEEEARKAEEEAKKAEEEAKRAEEEAQAKAKAEQEAREKAEQETADAFAPAKGKKGKKKKGAVVNLWDDAEEEAKKEEERLAKEKEEQELLAKEKEEQERLAREKEEQEAWEKEEKERKEREEREKAEKEAQEQAAVSEGGGEGGGGNTLFGSFGGGGWGSSSGNGSWGGFGAWGAKAKSKTPSIKSALGGWGSTSSFSNAFGMGDPDTPTEQVKLGDIGGTKTGGSLFDDFGTALSPNPLPVTIGDPPAATLDAVQALVHSSSKPPSRVPSRTPSRAPSPQPPAADSEPVLPVTVPADTPADAPTDPPPIEPAPEQAEPTAEEPAAPGTPGEAQTANADEEWGLPVKTKKKKAKGKGKK